jgi:hypothetical protein
MDRSRFLGLILEGVRLQKVERLRVKSVGKDKLRVLRHINFGEKLFDLFSKFDHNYNQKWKEDVQ